MLRTALFSVLISVAYLSAQSHKEYISGPFNSPQDVTNECLNCHENAAAEIMSTNHWTWNNEEFIDEENKRVRRGKNGYWKTFDWNLASQIGMKEVNLDYSGEYGFVENEMYWPINHMVAPKDKSLRCTNCHGVKGNRLDWKALGYSGDPMKIKGRKIQN